jgi:AraC-like DNA-binding protein
VDLKGRLSNPLEIAETLAAQGSEPIGGFGEGAETTQIRPSNDRTVGPREEKGRLSNPAQRRLSPIDIDDLISAYQAGATISQLAVEFGIHRTTVAGHLDRHGVARHNEQRVWDDQILRQAAELYATGLSLADVADQFGIDAQTVANRFRRAGLPVRSRRGWSARDHLENRSGPLQSSSVDPGGVDG